MLGSGTSSGVPVIGCQCAVCTSSNPRNRRTRPSVLLRFADGGGEERSVLVDTAPELRLQAVREGMRRLDAILFTHAHADHIFGLDDVRAFNFRQRASLPCYGSRETLAALRRIFAYVFEETQEGGGKPDLTLQPVDAPWTLFGRTVVPVPVLHGSLEVYGYRIGALAYVTDCSAIPEASLELLAGVEVLILGALRYHPHPTHFTVEEALAVSRRVGAQRTVFTHLSHAVDYDLPQVELPSGVEFGYDGLHIELG